MNRFRVLPFFIFFFAFSYISYAQETPRIQWQKCLGGTLEDQAQSIIQTSDGGYLIAGVTLSLNGDVLPKHGNGVYHNAHDGWIVKLNSQGEIEWQNCIGGTGDDWINSIIQTNDGGFVLVGYSNSLDGDLASTNHGSIDGWIVRLSSEGSIQWQKTFGGSGDDLFTSIIQTSSNDFIITGYTRSNDGDVLGNTGGFGAWIIKIDSAASSITWQKYFSGAQFHSLINTKDKGFAVAGNGRSDTIDGHITGFHGGNSDGLIIKFGSRQVKGFIFE